MSYFENTKLYHTLNPFRGRQSDFDTQCFMHQYDSEFGRGGSIKGRGISLLKLVLEPFNLILKIARKVAMIAVCTLLVLVAALRIGRHSYFSNLSACFKVLFSYIGSLVVTPFARTAATVRYLFGIIHPGFVFGFR